MYLHATVMRQEKGGAQRLVVHLFNDLNTTAHHALPVDDVPLREETVPIHDVRVMFRDGTGIGRVSLQPEGAELELQAVPGGVCVTVPKLEVHSLVVAELGGRP